MKGLAFGGFSINNVYTIAFRGSLLSSNSTTTDIIEFEIQGDFQVYFMSFHILIVKPEISYIWMCSGGTHTTECRLHPYPD
jgi:hypothetical protein